jgi:hypothetical protein
VQILADTSQTRPVNPEGSDAIRLSPVVAFTDARVLLVEIHR